MVLLYQLSQNPDFADSVKPLMNKLKDSEHMLAFLNDLSKFSQTFATAQNPSCNDNTPPKPPNEKEQREENKNPQSPTKGIADDFIQNILDAYLKNQIK